LESLAVEDVGIFWQFGLFYCSLVFLWHFSWQFGMFFPVLVLCIKKNLATLNRIPWRTECLIKIPIFSLAT
jgi:hypothetical protein